MFCNLHFSQGLRENVYNLIFCQEIENFKNMIINEISDEVHM